jgi:protein dithiol oxidoreductase (disulfide-forming)
LGEACSKQPTFAPDMKKLFRTLLLSLSLTASFAHAAPAAPVAGKDYTVMPTPQPTSAAPGKIEVIEFFWYGCPHCYAFEPALEAWVKKQGPRIEFKRIPALLRDDFITHSQMFYTLKSMGLDEKLTPAVFDEIVKKHDYLMTPQAQAAFLATQGVDPKKYMSIYNSFSVQGEVKQSIDQMRNYGVDSTPAVIVNGKYLVSGYIEGPGGTTSILDYLVQQIQNKKL